ncbi:MAG: ferredoxin [Thermoprotei archaeon]|nr:MAG: ferredoxin [Thermoprotei archaeon]RLF24754.1 MAG: ferredoxin [Thermoprotei archaeon]
MKKIVIFFEPMGRRVETHANRTILEVAREIGIGIRSDCGGLGLCGKCKIILTKVCGEVSKPTDNEYRFITPEELSLGYRLACQVRVLSGSVNVFIPRESRVEVGRRVVGVSVLSDEYFGLRPAVRKFHLKLPEPSLQDFRPDLERLRDALITLHVIDKESELQVPLDLLRMLPELVREFRWNLTVTMWHNKLISIEKGDTTRRMFGLAIDVGSSKILIHLVDLVTGKTIATDFVENPQLMYGEDIVTRITYASRSPENLRKLQRLVIEAINNVIAKMTSRAGIDVRDIYEAVVVGNSVMHHIFFGIVPKYIARSPYVPAVRRMISYPAKEVGLNINENGIVTSLPLIAGFVGADAVANLIATRIYESDEISLILDIGTNTEVLLGNSEIILAASAPSGPAFEGAQISCGMKAVAGAIESVQIDGSKVMYRTIGDLRPRGICGSGLIDLLAEMYRNKIIDERGKFVAVNNPRVIYDEVPRFIVVWKEESASGKNIAITARDIDELLLAKAAIRSGWTLLCKKLGIDPSDISKVYVAGSFGMHINVDNAISIGLLPPVDRAKVIFIGESAIIGARMALKSTEARRKAEDVVRNKVKYVELSADPEFRRIYIQSIPLNP